MPRRARVLVEALRERLLRSGDDKLWRVPVGEALEKGRTKKKKKNRGDGSSSGGASSVPPTCGRSSHTKPTVRGTIHQYRITRVIRLYVLINQYNTPPATKFLINRRVYETRGEGGARNAKCTQNNEKNGGLYVGRSRRYFFRIDRHIVRPLLAPSQLSR